MKGTTKWIWCSLLVLFVIGLIASLQAMAASVDMQANINMLIGQGKTGLVLQDLVMQRAAGIAPQNRPYVYDGYSDCYGFCRQVWNAILEDGSVHTEDYYPNSYWKGRWHSIAGGLPTATAPDPDWVYFSDPNVLLPGDVLATAQGHAWGEYWHGGIYAGKSGSTHYDYDCYYPDGAYKRGLYSGFCYYYKPLHDLLAMNSTVARPAVGMNTDGRLEAFMTGRDGLVYHSWQNTANGTWSSWYPFSGPVTGNPVVSKENNGSLILFVRGVNGDVLMTKQAQGWPAWTSHGGVTYGDPVIGTNLDGRLEFFTRGNEGKIFKKWQVTLNGNFTSTYDDLGGYTSHSPSVVRDQDGRQEVFIRWATDGVAHKWQNSPNGDWYANWDGSLGGGVKEEPFSIQSNSFDGGKVYIFVRGNTNKVYYKNQSVANGAWIADWIMLDGVDAKTRPVAAFNSNGTLMLFVVGTDGAVWSNRLTIGSGWSGWSSHGGVITSDLAIGKYQDGRMAIFGRGTNGRIFIRRQTSASSTIWTNCEVVGDDVDRF